MTPLPVIQNYQLDGMIGRCAERNPANTKYLYNIYTMLAQRLRRRSNILQMLYKCFVLQGNMSRKNIFKKNGEAALSHKLVHVVIYSHLVTTHPKLTLD